MSRLTSLVAVALVLLVGSACDRDPVAPSDRSIVSSLPSALAPSTFTAQMQPGVVAVTPVAGAICPAVQPFTTSVNLVVQSQSVTTMTVDTVTFRFLDGSNVSTRPITFPNGTLVPSAANVTLPFAVPFGCGIGVPQWAIVDVVAKDSNGTTHTLSLKVPTR